MVLVNCGGEPAPERKFADVDWRESVLLQSQMDDELLARPGQILVWGDELVVMDRVAPFVRVFDETGAPLRVFAEEGEGPGEIPTPFRIAARDSSRLLLLGSGGRIVEYSRDGTAVRTFTLPREAFGTDLVVRNDTILVPAYFPPSTAMVDAKSGDLVRTFPIEWADTLPPRALLRRMIAQSDDGTWISAPTSGPGFFIHDGPDERFAEFVDPSRVQDQEVPLRVVKLSVRSLFVRNDSTYMLFGGKTEYLASTRPELIDVYSGDGMYSHTLRLPRETYDIVPYREGLLAISLEPQPTLRYLVP